MGDSLDLLQKIAVMYIPFLFAICFHEFAHAWMALKRGDNTAQMMGRLTVSPLAHADMMGTVFVPLMVIMMGLPIFFGWAKPVPFNPRNLKNPRVDAFWIALAGPMSNVLLALIGALGVFLIVRSSFPHESIAAILTLLKAFIMINFILAAFNMIPLHPLDGGKVLARFLPTRWNDVLESRETESSLILMVLVLTGMLGFILGPVSFFADQLFRVAYLGWGM